MTTPWTIDKEAIAGTHGIRYSFHHHSKPLTFAEAIRLWQCNEEFRTFFNTELSSAPFTAYRWETPMVTTSTLERPFEFVLLDSPSLARQPEPEAFAVHFKDRSAVAVSFANLSGDAVMVVPCPIAESSAYGHLAAFVRHAPETQRQAFWQFVGKTMNQRIGTKPVWLSTAGAGVSWLHVRLDDRPKYYGYELYKKSN